MILQRYKLILFIRILQSVRQVIIRIILKAFMTILEITTKIKHMWHQYARQMKPMKIQSQICKQNLTMNAKSWKINWKNIKLWKKTMKNLFKWWKLNSEKCVIRNNNNLNLTKFTKQIKTWYKMSFRNTNTGTKIYKIKWELSKIKMKYWKLKLIQVINRIMVRFKKWCRLINTNLESQNHWRN